MAVFLVRRSVTIAHTVLIPAALTACGPKENLMSQGMTREPFGTAPDGQAVELFTLTNLHGIELKVTNYGGIVVSLKTPDRDGHPGDIVLGYPGLQGYLDDSPYFGAIVGRYGNRIGHARFELDGKAFMLAANDGANHLHGGRKGFDKVVWEAEPFEDEAGVGVVFRYTSLDGEEGYPGTLQVTVIYTLTSSDSWVVDYLATTDRATPVNLTQHSYFNLANGGSSDILSHELVIAADQFTPVDSALIPSGETVPVDGTPFDFRIPHAVGERIAATDAQIGFGRGYDHNWILNGTQVDGMTLAARVYEPSTGRTLEVLTTEPGVQFYSGNFLDGSITGKDRTAYGPRSGFCLETQHFPDSPNKEGFPSTILRPGEQYHSRTVFRFGSGK